MPTYEYECTKCNKGFEAFQSMKDDAFKTCPKEKCQMETWGEGAVRRLLGTGAGLIFKGSGFYITDYRSEGYKSAAQKDSSAGSASSGGESKKSDSGGSSTPATPTPPASKPAENKTGPKKTD